MISHTEFETFYNRICHYDRYLGLQLSVQGPGQITYLLTVDERHLSMPPACHGGVIAGMMDATLGVTALSWAVEHGKLCATVEFKTHFFAPVKAGDRLQGSGAIDFVGSRLVVTTAHITATATLQLVAKGIGTFTLYPATKRKDLLELLEKMR